MPSTLQRPAQHAAASESEEQGQSGHGRGQDDGQVDEHIRQPLAPELAARQEQREGRPEQMTADRLASVRDQAQDERIEDGLAGGRGQQLLAQDRPGQERDHRQSNTY